MTLSNPFFKTPKSVSTSTSFTVRSLCGSVGNCCKTWPWKVCILHLVRSAFRKGAPVFHTCHVSGCRLSATPWRSRRTRWSTVSASSRPSRSRPSSSSTAPHGGRRPAGPPAATPCRRSGLFCDRPSTRSLHWPVSTQSRKRLPSAETSSAWNDETNDLFSDERCRDRAKSGSYMHSQGNVSVYVPSNGCQWGIPR